MNSKIVLGLVAVGLLVLVAGSASASPAAPPSAPPAPAPAPAPAPPADAGDLEVNWGETPAWLRPLLLETEAAAKIRGLGRFLAIVARGEAGPNFNPSAHNQDADEVDDSTAAYEAGKNQNPPLAYGAEAAAFGSGGLFGALAPYYLWTGVPGGDAKPLLGAKPETVFDPPHAAAAAAVFAQRLIAHYPVKDWADVRAGWGWPALLKSGYGGVTHNARRLAFLDRAANMGIDLNHPTMPPPDASAWPGVAAVFGQLVG